jgi:hypothetical protein
VRSFLAVLRYHFDVSISSGHQLFKFFPQLFSLFVLSGAFVFIILNLLLVNLKLDAESLKAYKVLFHFLRRELSESALFDEFYLFEHVLVTIYQRLVLFTHVSPQKNIFKLSCLIRLISKCRLFH